MDILAGLEKWMLIGLAAASFSYITRALAQKFPLGPVSAFFLAQ